MWPAATRGNVIVDSTGGPSGFVSSDDRLFGVLQSTADMTMDTDCPVEGSVATGSPVHTVVEGDGQQSPSTLPKKNMKRQRITRLVSQDVLGMFDDDATPCTPATVPTLPNPLENSTVLKTHVAALRLEADLHPMRLTLARLMAHPTFNRKGLFNQPVDPVALALPDYHLIVTQPMDLGTIKRRLHAVAYESRQQVVGDIRLVFSNAMRYNPPHNAVHKCAQELLALFEEWNGGDCNELKQEHLTPNEPMRSNRTAAVKLAPVCRMVSSVAEDQQNSSMAATEKSSAFSHEVPPIPANPGVPLERPSVDVQQHVPAAPSRRKRKSRLPPFLPHSCSSCQGRNCKMCHQGCLVHEPALLVCQGVHCGGSKIRKGSAYYVSSDGQRHYCQRCFTNLTPVLPSTSEGDACRYKQDLLKRKNDEEIAEDWLTCSECSAGVHAICAMHNGYVHMKQAYLCPDCRGGRDECGVNTVPDEPGTSTVDKYTFVSGSDTPVPMPSMGSRSCASSAESLPECAVSSFIQGKVAKQMKAAVPNSDKTIAVRVISDSVRQFHIPEVIRKHFRMETNSDSVIKPPSQVRYRQKAITLFQKIDGLDVCIFCMYVHEYDGDDEYDSQHIEHVKARHDKRVYIAYIDSVEHFRPRQCRTEVYQEVLVSYLATARARGFETAQIWACPPSRGNSFVFWNHPSSQRTPTRERLVSWYHDALSRAVGCGVVTNVNSLYESEFETHLSELDKLRCSPGASSSAQSGRMICPPLLDGDFWIEEAARVHEANLSRYIKVRAPTDVCVWNVAPLQSEELDPCPALQFAKLVKDRVMTHPSSVPFRRPVNAASMKLTNYHKIITKPMDLGTIYARCIVGEYTELRQVVEDVNLMVANAKKFNPPGHIVCLKADEVSDLFFKELSALVSIWSKSSKKEGCNSWEAFADMSMSLDKTLTQDINTNPQCTSVVIEDDRSSDGSRSVSSSVSAPSSPMSRETKEKDENQGQAAASLSASNKSKSVGKSSRGGRQRGQVKKGNPPPKKLDLLSDGPEAVLQSMVGEDFWLLDKRNPSTKPPTQKQSTKRRKVNLSSADVTIEEPSHKRRRQCWLGEEVSDSVRRIRTSLFTCSMLPKKDMTMAEQEKLRSFKLYVEEFAGDANSHVSMSSPITDTRHALLEFSQFRHFEFDTLRRAKYSTAMLIYHLKNPNAPGAFPMCSTCDRAIEEIRWHKVKKVAEKRRVTKFMKPTKPIEPTFIAEELCGSCYAGHSVKEEFIPIPVSRSH